MPDPTPSPLVVAAERARESMLILLDYLKIASNVHDPDEYRPAIKAVADLSCVIENIYKLRSRTGDSGCAYIGGVSAE
jgi:hypothetical protein